MAIFQNTVITNKGLALLAKSASGSASVVYTVVKTSSYQYPDGTDLAALTSLNEVQQSVPITSVERPLDTQVNVNAFITNAGVTAGYYVRNLGLYANDPDEGEILFSVTKATTADYFPPETSVASLIVSLILQVSATSNITLMVDPAGTVTQIEFQAVVQQVAGKAPTAHADPTTKFGPASAANYGHVMFGTNLTALDAALVLPFTRVSERSSVDLNSYKTLGAYTFHNITTSAINFPDGTWTGTANTCYLEVRQFGNDVNIIHQTIYKKGTLDVWTRISTGASTWNAWQKVGSGSGFMPQIIVSVETGSTVTCTDGTTTLTGISVNNSYTFNIPNFGNWTVSATLAGQTSGSVVVTVNQVTQYAVQLTYFLASLTVTAEAGAAVTIVNGERVFTQTAAADGKTTFSIAYAGTYTVKAVLNNAGSSTTSVSVSTSGSNYTATVTFMTLTVTVDSGSAVQVTNGTVTLNGVSTGTAKFYLPAASTWQVIATLSGETATGSIATSTFTAYSITLSYVKITGVEWNYNSSSTALTRLKKATDPNAYVTVDINTNPVPAVGTGGGSSPFDALMPWSGMDEFNVISNVLSYQKGATNFSRTANDTVVRIPKFYYKVEKDTANGKMRFYVADKAKAGFSVHPAFARGDGGGERPYIYVGKYNTASGYVTKSGLAPLASITRAAARTGSANKGAPWWQYDYAAWSAIWLLYLVEFADWDSQTKIGRGYVDGNSAAINSGQCDTMSYHTGRPSGTVGKTAVMYRWIENPWGNVYDFVDGINFNERLAYVCLNPAQFADDTATNYTTTGITLPSSGWIMSLGLSTNFPWAFLPLTVGGSETTYIPDYVYSNTGWRVLYVGGNWGNTGYAGLFCFGAVNASTIASANFGARLLFLP